LHVALAGYLLGGDVYSMTVRTDLIAQHYLIGGDWGAENERHSHHYVLELRLDGADLNEHGYLVDIVQVEAELRDIRAHFADRCLNELPEFEGLNPSIEHFARIVCLRLGKELAAPNLSGIAVRLWENDIASASYRQVV
jgi:6-pyruvoyltetrahydropterin/6-carboxytetrahydropterin synthase